MIPIINVKETGKQIGILIHESGYSVRDISKEFDLTPKSVYNWMDGTYLPKLEHLVALAYMLHVSIDDILIFE
jgi:DNA-binding XRE family transcriptional regulator